MILATLSILIKSIRNYSMNVLTISTIPLSAMKSHALTRVNGGPTSNIDWLQNDVTEQCEGATKSKVK